MSREYVLHIASKEPRGNPCVYSIVSTVEIPMSTLVGVCLGTVGNIEQGKFKGAQTMKCKL